MKYFNIRFAAFLVIFFILNSLTAQNQLSGIVNYHENSSNPLPNVTLELFDANDNLIATTLSNNNGEYIFSDVPSGEYILRSTASLNTGEVNLIDASLILQHIFGWYSFNEYEFTAADVNGSGSITFSDYILVLIGYIMQNNPFPTDEWQFEELYIDFSARGDTTERDLWGTSTGDVEGVWFPGGRNIDLLPEEYQNATTINNKVIELEVGSSYNDLISGFNLNLTYPINLIEITDVTGPDDNFHYNLDETSGVLKVIWLDENTKPGIRFFGETLFRITVKQISNSIETEEGIFSLLEGGMILDNKSNQIKDVTIKLPKISTTSPNLEFELISYPNPVINNINFKITSPDNNYAFIYIYDLNGRLVQETLNMNIYKGTQLINLNTESLTSGNYLYKVKLLGVETVSGRFCKAN